MAYKVCRFGYTLEKEKEPKLSGHSVLSKSIKVTYLDIPLHWDASREHHQCISFG
jgi:hypothetical protein